jgi:hypothetical protein
MTDPEDALAAGLRIARAFEESSIPYALGGALAYGQYGIPRATNDVDVNVFVDAEELARVFHVLHTLGIDFEDGWAREKAVDEGLFVVRLGSYRVDVFTPSIAFSWEAARTRVRHHFDGVDVWFLSAEALCVFKLLFFRGKDVVDLERLIAVQGQALDVEYIRARIVEMLGEDDARVVTWDRLCQEHRSGS